MPNELRSMGSDPADPAEPERAEADGGAAAGAVALVVPAHVGGGPWRKSLFVWAILIGGICCFGWAAMRAVDVMGAGSALPRPAIGEAPLGARRTAQP